jgi:hypothetical protein
MPGLLGEPWKPCSAWPTLHYVCRVQHHGLVFARFVPEVWLHA